MHLKTCLKSAFLTSAAIWCAGGYAFAAESGAIQSAAASAVAESGTSMGGGVETVVVTARRRSETLLEAPVAVTAISGADLRNSGITDIKSIISLVPNAVIQDDATNNNTYINIRGMRQVDIQAEPNFGLYRNGLYYGGFRTNLGSQVDLERVEILRGPQGGLYGRNAVGGAVNVIYAMPTYDFGGYVKASYGSYDAAKIEGAVNLPLDDMLSVRVAGWYFNQSSSEIYNETLDEHVGVYQDKGLRISLRADLTSALSVVWAAEYQNYRGPSLRTYAPNGVVNGGIRSQPETFDRIRRDTPSESKWDQFYLSQKIAYQTDVGEFSLNASFRNYGLDATYDSDQTAIPPTAAPTVRQTTIIRDEGIQDYYVEGLWQSPSEEDFTWIAGVSYFHEIFDFARMVRSNRDLSSMGWGIATYRVGYPNVGTKVKTNSISAFASATYKLTDQLSVTGGLRWSRDEKTLVYSQGLLSTGDPAQDAFFNAALGAIYPTFTLNSSPVFEFVAPSVTIDYMVDPATNLYASYSTGFRAGAFNMTSTSPATIPYGQETAKNYEVGLKKSWVDGRLSTNLAAFYMRQDDLLFAQVDPVAWSLGLTYLANVGSADNLGFELEAVGQLLPWLSAGVSVGWLDAHFDKAISNIGTPDEQDLSGKRIPGIRNWTFNAMLDANYPISDRFSLIGTASMRYEGGGVLGDYYILDPYAAETKIDLSAGVAFEGATRLTVYVDNLLDQHIPQFYFYNGAANVSPGRTFGVSLTHNF